MKPDNDRSGDTSTNKLTSCNINLLKANNCLASQQTSHLLCKPQGSLLCSQEATTRPFLSQINPVHTLSNYFKISFSIILSLMPRSLFFRSFKQNIIHFSSSPCMLHVPTHPTLLHYLIILTIQYLVKNINCEDPDEAIFPKFSLMLISS